MRNGDEGGPTPVAVDRGHGTSGRPAASPPPRARALFRVPRSALGTLLVALGFLTALPVPRAGAPSARSLGRSLVAFPLVGALIGALLAATDRGLAFVLPAGVRTALLLIATVALTRGLHLDGLMDACDGLFGGFTPERRLAIMRDSRVGAFGVLGAALALLLRYAGLTALAGPWRLVGLILPPIVGRWALVYAMVRFPYGRPEGLGAAFTGAAGRRELLGATGAALVVGAAAWWPWGALGLLPGVLCAALCARAMLRRLPGLTGDCYGAINEVVEGAMLVIVVGARTLAGGT